MNHSDNQTMRSRRHPNAMTSKVGQLLDFLLADTMNDIDVVARELHLRDEIRDRLRRSLDRLFCAQSVVEALCRELAVDAHDDGGRDDVDPMDGVLRAMETLATRWPQDYGSEAVEWLVLDECDH